jgi:hypothetical protein
MRRPDHLPGSNINVSRCQLEQFHRFVRAHLETADGSQAARDASTEKAAAECVK